jgi:hypothetical protein
LSGEQQEGHRVDAGREKQLPVLDAEEEQCRAGERVEDVQVAGDAEHPHRVELTETHQDDQRDGDEILAEPVQPRQDRAHHHHQHVVRVERQHAGQIVERGHHQIGSAARRRRIAHHVDTALAAHELRIARHDTRRQQPIEPCRKREAGLRLASHQVAQSCHCALAPAHCMSRTQYVRADRWSQIHNPVTPVTSLQAGLLYGLAINEGNHAFAFKTWRKTMTKTKQLMTAAFAVVALATASIAVSSDASAKGNGGGGRGMGGHSSFGGGKFAGGGKFIGGGKFHHHHRWHGHRYGYGYGYNTCWKWTPAGLVNVCVVPY